MKDIKKSQQMAQFMYVIMDFYTRTEAAYQQGTAPQVASPHRDDCRLFVGVFGIFFSFFLSRGEVTQFWLNAMISVSGKQK